MPPPGRGTITVANRTSRGPSPSRSAVRVRLPSGETSNTSEIRESPTQTEPSGHWATPSGRPKPGSPGVVHTSVNTTSKDSSDWPAASIGRAWKSAHPMLTTAAARKLLLITELRHSLRRPTLAAAKANQPVRNDMDLDTFFMLSPPRERRIATVATAAQNQDPNVSVTPCPGQGLPRGRPASRAALRARKSSGASFSGRRARSKDRACATAAAASRAWFRSG